MDQANGDQDKALALYTRFRVAELERAEADAAEAEADAELEARKQAVTQEQENNAAQEKYLLCSENPSTQSLEPCSAFSFGLAVLCMCFTLFWVLAVPLGIIGLSRVESSKGRLKGSGYAWAGIILSMLLGITWPGVMRALRD